MAHRNVDGAALVEVVRRLATPPVEQLLGRPAVLSLAVLIALQRVVRSDYVTYDDFVPRDRRTVVYADSSMAPADDPLADDPEGDAILFRHYWSGPCSHPDRTGDWESVVVLSDLCSLREWRAGPLMGAFRAVSADLSFDRNLLVPLPSPPGHSRRVEFQRVSGRDFDDVDRAVATLLRPHLAAHLQALDLRSRGITPLTRRQAQLMSLVVDGRSNLQIARVLGISPATVRTHLQQVYARLGVASRGEAAAVFRTSTAIVPAREPEEWSSASVR